MPIVFLATCEWEYRHFKVHLSIDRFVPAVAFFFKQLYCSFKISKFGSLSPWKASCDRVALPNLQGMLRSRVCVCVSIILQTLAWSVGSCMHVCGLFVAYGRRGMGGGGGPRFSVLSEGLLWGIESAQTLTPGNVVPSRRTEPSRKRSPIRVAVTLDPALPRLPEREVSIPEKGSWLSFFLPAAGYRGRRNTPPHTHTPLLKPVLWQVLPLRPGGDQNRAMDAPPAAGILPV